MGRYAWGELGQEEGSIVSGRLSEQIRQRFQLPASYSYGAAVEAALAELVAGGSGSLTPYSFGARGDGIVDDTRAVQDWLDAGVGVNGLLLPTGRFRCTGQLRLPSQTYLFGTGWRSVLFFDWTDASGALSGGDTYLVNSDTVNGNALIMLSRLQIEGVGNGLPFGNPPTPPASGLLLRRATDVAIDGVRFYRVPGVSGSLQGVRRFQYVRNQVYQSGKDGLTLGPFGSSDMADGVVGANVIREVGDDGIALNKSVDTGQPGTNRPRNIDIVDNTIFGQTQFYSGGAGRGIILFAVEDCTVANNAISDTFSYGLFAFVDDATLTVKSRNVTVSGNVVRRAGAAGDGSQPRDGMVFAGCEAFTVKGNTAVDGADSGFRVTDSTTAAFACEDISLEGNIARGNGLHGFNISAGLSGGMTRVALRGNKARNNGGWGIILNSANIVGSTITDNDGTGNTSGFISNSDTSAYRRGNRATTGPNQGRAVLVNGTVTVTTTEVVAADNIQLTRVVGAGTTRGTLTVGTITAGTSFVIRSEDAAGALSADDDSTVFWELVH